MSQGKYGKREARDEVAAEMSAAQQETETAVAQEESFDPSEHNADEVKEALAEAGAAERDRIATQELAGKARKSVLEAAGVDPNERRDASGRVLHPWETLP